MDILFHCSKNALKCVRKSSHRVGDTCNTLKIILARNPEYGVLVRGQQGLRKMRVKVPSLNTGKRGGYRCIYRCETIDEVMRIVFLSTYYKGDKEDLSNNEYKTIQQSSDEILTNSSDYDWDT